MLVNIHKDLLQDSISWLEAMQNAKPMTIEEVELLKKKQENDLLEAVSKILIQVDYPDATLPDSKEKYLAYAQALVKSGWVHQDC